MPGDMCPPLSRKELKERIDSPIHSERIETLAKHGKEAVIVFDDLSRGTPVQDLAELVLEALARGGIGKGHVRFICALGSHAAHTRADMVMKLGERIVEEYPVFNHDAFGSCVRIGTDRYGNPVEINAEFMNCDVRIGIGSVTPHPMNGYGGGGKLLFPGIASMETIVSNHRRKEYGPVGAIAPSGMRQDIERLTQMAGQFFAINALLNARLDIIDLYAGSPTETYYAAAKAAAKTNAMLLGKPKDVVFANANAKYNESHVAVKIASRELRDNGDIVFINHCPAGQVVHYAFNAFGKNCGGPLFTPFEQRKKLKCRRVIYYTPFPDYVSKLKFEEPEKVIFAKTWKEVLTLLGDHGEGTTASILSDGTIGYFPDGEG